MRIGTGSFYQNASDTILRLQRELGNLTDTLSSGKRVNKPSDDPLASTVIANAHTQIAQSTARKRVFESGLTLSSAGDSALATISTDLGNAADAALATLQTGQIDQSRQATAAQIRSIANSLLVTANTKVGDRYVFAGFQDRATPFSDAGGTVTYAGDSGQLSVPVGEGRSCQVAMAGDQVLNFVDSGGQRAVRGVNADAFTVLSELASSVESGDTTAARQRTDDLQALRDNVVQLRADLGSSTVRLQAASTAADDVESRCNQILADQESTDITQTMTDYSDRETNYRAVLQVLSGIMAMPTLFDLSR